MKLLRTELVTGAATASSSGDDPRPGGVEPRPYPLRLAAVDHDRRRRSA